MSGLLEVPLIAIAKKVLFGVLSNFEYGELRFIYKDEDSVKAENPKSITFGREAPSASIYVNNDWFWVRVFFSGSLGLAEAYMFREIECPDLYTVFKICLDNQRRNANANTDRSRNILAALAPLFTPSNTITKSKQNVSEHYDLSNTIFAAFLSPDMSYSCPLWLPPHDADYSEDTLQKAQERKYSYHIKAARIQSSDHVLEIGTGWGSFAIQAVRETGCTVTTITLAKEQVAWAEREIRAAGFQDKITVVCCDYREVVQRGIKYDKIVSIEMMEHLGLKHLDTYFSTINELLVEDGGIATFQCTMVSEWFRKEGRSNTSFINKYIFPGGALPTLTEVEAAINTGADKSLIIDRVESLGGYGRALAEWSLAFESNFESEIRPELVDLYPSISEEGIEMFRRKWLFYFAYCQIGFDMQALCSKTVRVRRKGTHILAADYYS